MRSLAKLIREKLFSFAKDGHKKVERAIKKVNLTILSFLLFIIFNTCIVALTKLFAETSAEIPLKEAMFYQKLPYNKVQCYLCFRKCIIHEGKRGFCRVRENQKGKLYTLVWGKPVGLQIDPIELEPMYHMIPGHRNLCVFTASCNFRCKHCHNWHISQKSVEELPVKYYLPQEVVKEAIRRNCKSISHSINEPTVFYEYMYDIAKEARTQGLKNLFHTNGSISPEPLRKLLKYMDAVTVDLKAFTNKFYNEISCAELEAVMETLKIIKQEKVHLEIVNLIIPTLNDNLKDIKRMCKWIKDNLGKDVPLHFTRFFPNYQLSHLPPTPIKTLEKARKIALETGLEYVYIGNVAGHEGNNTYCPKCKSLLIKRIHFVVIENKIDKSGRCKFCNHKIPGIWN